jgi:methylated-DNA-protein-cysteine methyltransferase related protein
MSPAPEGADPAPPSTDLGAAVAAVLTASVPGTVLSYGELAAEAGRPGAARAVGRVLSRGGADLPWWRVVTADGRLAPGHEVEQAARLREEGVACAAGRVVAAPRRRPPAAASEDHDVR